MKQPETDPRIGQNEVTTDANGVIIAVLHGKQTVSTVRELTHELQRQVAVLQAKNKKILVLADIRALTKADSTSGTRLESKKLLTNVPTDGSAVIGRGLFMSAIMYLLRVTQTAKHVRFFRSERKAREWLENIRHPRRKPLEVGFVTGVVLIAVGILTLLGWQLDNAYLTSWLPSLRPMNPMSAVGIMVIGFGFICYWANRLKWLRYTGVFSLLLGFLALTPVPVSYLLYGTAVADGPHNQIAASGALCFLAMGVVALIAGRPKWWVRPLEYLAAAVLAGLSLCNIFGQMYDPTALYSWGNFVMAYNLAAAFAIATIGLVLLVVYRQFGKNVLHEVSRIGWLIILIVVVAQAATYASWQQATTRNQSEVQQALETRTEQIRSLTAARLQAYINSLRGFRGLFAASDYVSRDDFSNYYNSLDLAQNYPGLRSLIFVSAVKDQDLPAFVAAAQKNKVLPDGSFSIKSKTGQPLHFILTYVAGSSTSANVGLDIGSIAGRQQLYSAALASNDVYGSGSVVIPASSTAPAQKGFFITTPVASGLRPSQPIGVVNAVLNYDVFFTRLFDSSVTNDSSIHFVDTTTNQTIYQNQDDSEQTAYTKTTTLPVANRSWKITVAVDKAFGIGQGQTYLPAIFLVVGQALSVFLLIIFLMQARGRKQALDLADSITKDLQHERNEAVASDQKSNAILESIGDGVFAIDTHGRIVLLNPVAQALSGFTAEEAIGKLYHKVLHFEYEKNGKVNDLFIRRALAGHMASMTNHTVIIRKDGKKIAVADSAAPIRDAKEKIIGAIVVFRDVSKEYELDKAKTEFVSLASHQLRTPLSAINWYGEMLLAGDAGKLSNDQHEYIDEIVEGSKRMAELVNSLLDVSRLEVGKLANQPAPTNVAALIDDLQKELVGQIETKHLVFKKHVDSIPDVVADPKQLRMIVQNLMSNAVKYTEKGAVTVTLRTASDQIKEAAKLHTTEPCWFFSVTDTGYGIPVDQQSKIFGKLYRADNVRRLDVEGTGLGLYIVKEVVEKMGGRVWFESAEGKGSTFYVVAPIHTKRPK